MEKQVIDIEIQSTTKDIYKPLYKVNYSSVQLQQW